MCNPPVCVYIVYTLGSGYRRKRRCRHVKSTGRNSRDEIVFEHSGASESHIHIRQVYTTFNTTYTYTICMLSISITIYHNVRRAHNCDLRLVFVYYAHCSCRKHRTHKTRHEVRVILYVHTTAGVFFKTCRSV